MRSRVPLFLFAASCSAAVAQPEFGPQVIIEGCETEEARVVLAADIDGDGDTDVVSGSERDGRVAWYANDGAGQFGPQQVISSAILELHWVHAADLNGDGDIDLLASSWEEHALFLFENDGTGAFAAPVTMVTMAYGMDRPTTADLDGDGDVDVLACSPSSPLSWFPNDGQGAFGPPQAIDASVGPETAVCGDVDADGDMDIVCNREIGVICILNNGDGTFAPWVALPGAQTYCNNVEVADVNGDGILDAVASSAYATQHSLIFIGVGDGSFLPVENLYGSGGSYTIPADMDGDGDQDLVSASGFTNDYTGRIQWYANDGSGTFDLVQLFTTSAYQIRTLYAADLDADGDQDILSASEADDKIAWYRNEGGGVMSPQIIITEAASAAIMAFGADVDGDGDNDVVAASFNDYKLAWYPNDGAGNLGPIQYVTTTAKNPWKMAYTDMDADGDVDILLGTLMDSSVTLYKNNGSGVFDELVVIDDDLYYPTAIDVADMDGDGDLDVLSTSLDVGVFWYTNEGGDVYTKHNIGSTTGFGDVVACDIDNDGDMDAIFDQGATVKWRVNNGAGTFGSVLTLVNLGVVDHIVAVDMDEDGDQDLVLGNSTTLWISWNDALTFTTQMVDDDIDHPVCFEATDVDVDGDLDLLAAASYGNYIRYYENLGGAVFAPPIQVTDQVDFPRWVSSADLNGDGKLDVISASDYDNKVAWYSYSEPAITLSAVEAKATPASLLTVTPDPVSDIAYLVADRNMSPSDRIELVDGRGSIVRSIRGNGSTAIVLEREGLCAGPYLARLVSNGRHVGSVRLIME